AAGHRADDLTGVLVEYLLRKQCVEGSWLMPGNREPSQGSQFTTTALAVRGLRAYAPRGGTKEQDELRRRIDRAVGRALKWLRKTPARSTEDSVFRLRGLISAGASKTEVEAARAELLRAQRADGSWAQLPEMAGDGYATGTVLAALRAAGLAVD